MNVNPLNLLAAPLVKIVSAVTMLLVAVFALLWLVGFMAEKTTGIESLPQLIAPARHEPQEKLAEDQRDCIMYNVLVDTKGVPVKSASLDEKIIRTILNYSRVNKTRPCEILHSMGTLVALGDERKVVGREDWAMQFEFAFDNKRKDAIRALIKEVEANPDPTWEATHYIRHDRSLTFGNQTEAEKKRLRETLDAIPKGKITQADGSVIDDPLDGGFEFFKPKKPKR